MKNFQIIKEAAKKFWKNPILMVPYALQFLVNLALSLIFAMIFVAIFGTTIEEMSTTPGVLMANVSSISIMIIIPALFNPMIVAPTSPVTVEIAIGNTMIAWG